MALFLKVGVDDWIYWGVRAHASERRCTQGQIICELIGEALRSRASKEQSVLPACHHDEVIAQAAGLEGLGFEDMRQKLLGLGWMTFCEDLYEHAQDAVAS